uniref:Uncharacterized protein n=1 Tax=Setaria viridis TaxID=4556 RepID=A0A4U6TGC8_SETVI|nr:hypothetical protein SEVIR_8G086866v2 [Setaria viridis]
MGATRTEAPPRGRHAWCSPLPPIAAHRRRVVPIRPFLALISSASPSRTTSPSQTTIASNQAPLFPNLVRPNSSPWCTPSPIPHSHGAYSSSRIHFATSRPSSLTGRRPPRELLRRRAAARGDLPGACLLPIAGLAESAPWPKIR